MTRSTGCYDVEVITRTHVDSLTPGQRVWARILRWQDGLMVETDARRITLDWQGDEGTRHLLIDGERFSTDFLFDDGTWIGDTMQVYLYESETDLLAHRALTDERAQADAERIDRFTDWTSVARALGEADEIASDPMVTPDGAPESLPATTSVPSFAPGVAHGAPGTHEVVPAFGWSPGSTGAIVEDFDGYGPDAPPFACGEVVHVWTVDEDGQQTPLHGGEALWVRWVSPWKMSVRAPDRSKHLLWLYHRPSGRYAVRVERA